MKHATTWYQHRIYHAQLWWSVAMLTVTDRFLAQPGQNQDEDADRGDVPGWVMITVMTAIMVIALLTVFRQQVVSAVEKAFKSVSGA